jgi:acyl-CoA-binding protein
MSDFETAVNEAKALPKKPGNDDLLKLYALYKQATTGNVEGKRPGVMDFVGRAKHDAWAALEGMSPEAAKDAYVDLVDSLKQA